MQFVVTAYYDLSFYQKLHKLFSHTNTDQNNIKYYNIHQMNVLMFQEKVDLGELMMSLCYLPTAGRLTVTVIKARNLKPMDLNGNSGTGTTLFSVCNKSFN